MSRASRQVLLVQSYVLHQRPYRDSGRLIEAFTREQGRVTLFARGVRGPKSRLAPVLQPFRPLLLSFLMGRGDAGQLTAAETVDAAAPALPAAALMPAWYLNELLLKLAGRLDPQPALFDAYVNALRSLGGRQTAAAALRAFEFDLLHELGYGIDVTGVRSDAAYRFDAGVGFARSSQGDALPGRALQGMAEGRWDEAAVQAVAARVLRAALDHCLEGRELRTRTVARAVHRRVAR